MRVFVDNSGLHATKDAERYVFLLGIPKGISLMTPKELDLYI